MQFDEAVTSFSEMVDFRPGSCVDSRVLKNPDKRASCDSARRAVTPYSRWPTQAITYRLGKDQIIALRKRGHEKFGGQLSANASHLPFMKQWRSPAPSFAHRLAKHPHIV